MKIQVLVKAGAKKNEVMRVDVKNYKVSVKAPPTEGKANTAVIECLAVFFGVPKSSITILFGHKSRTKVIEVLQ